MLYRASVHRRLITLSVKLGYVSGFRTTGFEIFWLFVRHIQFLKRSQWHNCLSSVILWQLFLWSKSWSRASTDRFPCFELTHVVPREWMISVLALYYCFWCGFHYSKIEHESPPCAFFLLMNIKFNSLWHTFSRID